MRVTALLHTRFLGTLEQLRFSGQLEWTTPSGQRWLFYLSQGLIMYATGGEHLVRRWQRLIAMHCPRKLIHRVAWQTDLGNVDVADLRFGWEYALLNLWVARQDITPEQAARIVRSVVTEVLFDVTQAVDVTNQISQDSSFSSRLILVPIQEAIAETQRLLQVWQNANLADYSPNQAPAIKQSEQLQKHSSPQFYQSLANLLNGQQTLRELAVQTKRDAAAIAVSLLPFIRLGWVELTRIPDLAAPVYRRQGTSNASLTSAAAIPQAALIACVDDSFVIHRTLDKLVTSAGYRFIGIDNPLRAINMLLTRKPDFIFLDLVMPNANGYEICEQLRKLSCFRNTPIVILTGNDGYANRLKSNFAGANAFLSKPLDAEAVLGVIRKHLEQSASNLSVATTR
ncbi:MAG: response regulator [Leptolyngbyaceae cyanobacterium RU_5_1]|nr:response regulator [Leptolyngbyaceae cyanobacterium RU_5_1]